MIDFLPLLSQASPAQPEGPSWFSVMGNIVNVAFSVVVGWYLLTKALPKMQEDFRAELALQRVEHDRREKERQEAVKDALKMVIDYCEREGTRSGQLLKNDVAASGKAVDDAREILRDVREMMRAILAAMEKHRPAT